MKWKAFFFLAACIGTAVTKAQQINVYPAHWWTGMNHTEVQLMIHGSADLADKITVRYPGVKVKKVHQPENKHYVFVDIEISAATKPGSFEIGIGDKQRVRYELRPKSSVNGKTRVKGVDARDCIYLIMPDRFVNGDPSNDVVQGLRDTRCDRTNPFLRHGGDIPGVESRLDYLKDLGMTTVWMTPVMENDMPVTKEGNNEMSGYHGYWITNHYKVDPRHGGNEAYKKLVETAHGKGMKVVQDAVYNHVGAYHHTVVDLPMNDWLNNWPSYQGANHRDEVFIDPYASAIDKKIMIGGWFVPHLPDLNLSNPYVARFIIQSSIWSTEEFGIDGWRVDTYKYCDEQFLNDINTALTREFPSLTVFGEAWTQTVTAGAYFTKSSIEAPFRHNLMGVTDFPLNSAIIDAVNQPFGWTEGVNRLYMTLAQDLLYRDPMRNCIFLDNHDMNRFVSMVGEKPEKFKQGIGLLMTLRGIPQIYYGTEIWMKNFKNPTDAEVRRDFPGGWKDDSGNKFLASGRQELEEEVFRYTQKLARFRQNSPALTSGKTMQYIPQDGVYVYFRYTAQETLMCVLNSGKEEKKLDLARFSERLSGFSTAERILEGGTIQLNQPVVLAPGVFSVYRCQR